MAKKGVFSVIATIAIVGVVVGVFSQTVLRCKRQYKYNDFGTGICGFEQQDKTHWRAGSIRESAAARCI